MRSSTQTTLSSGTFSPFLKKLKFLVRQLRQQRIRIGSQDFRMAALALFYSFTVVTSNVRDFSQDTQPHPCRLDRRGLGHITVDTCWKVTVPHLPSLLIIDFKRLARDQFYNFHMKFLLGRPLFSAI